MTPETWEKVKQIFNEALDVPTAERPTFLRSVCGDDETLFSQIKELVDSVGGADDRLEAPALGSISKMVKDPAGTSKVGQIIGAYKIECAIGTGGMGAVFLASRADEAFDKKVALKLIKRGFDTDEIVRRFQHERQILAGLEHANITRLLDGGSTNDGLPYLVMDYVDGQPLNKFSNERMLSIEKRLEIFLQICSAVSYAHRNLVVHRDLKPSNILVTSDGVPKLLDFGIAKLMAVEGENGTIEKTIGTITAMTPDYASPEQFSGRHVTTASDIYSLGVVLYELLTGHRPFHFKTHSADEVSRFLDETSPTKPSSICRTQGVNVSLRSPQNAIRTLQGDLDNIVLMAIRKEPERRYSSVDQFADDIKRHLAGLPVIAREETVGYRMSKFIQRNKAGVGAGVGIAASLIGGLVAARRQARIASLQRDRAWSESRKAEKVNRFLQKMLASADPRRQGKDVKLTEILDIASRSIEKDFAEEPEIVADLQSTIGLTLLSQGKLDAAEQSLKRALEIRADVLGYDHHDTAVSQYNFGQLLETRGDAPEAEKYYRRSLKTLRQFTGGELEVANVLHNLAHASALQGKNADAITLSREAISIRRELLGEGHPDVERSLTELGSVLTTIGDTDAAEALQKEALAVIRRSYGDEHPDTATILINLFGAIQHKRPAEGERLVVEALRIRRKLLGKDHPDVAWTLYHLSYLKISAGKAVDAEKLSGEILSMRGSTLADENILVSNSLIILGRSLMAQRRLREAESVLRECLALRKKYLLPDHYLLSTTNGFLGECLMLANQRETGAHLLLDSHASLKAKLGEEHMHTQLARERIRKYLDRT